MPQNTGPRAFTKHKSSKVTRKKTGTATEKKHRFQSFTDRVAKLNIDAVRRNQSRQNITEDDESHFRAALDEWKDRNMSGTFTDFTRQVDPICQNLPQIIHYQDDIASILHSFVRKADALALEPLLILVAQFAHDIGARFEKHFQTTVEIINTIAATHSDVAVIEWSFTCLAWLFKYLARLLVPDLRPLYSLMAPLLGKSLQKDFVTRFAAEAMSFLVRKAALSHLKNPKALNILMEHVFADLTSASPQNLSLYQHGLATLFSESIKGVQQGTAGGGTITVKALLNYINAQAHKGHDCSTVQRVIEAVIIDLIHHTNAEGFEPIIATFLETSCADSANDLAFLPNTQLMYVIIGTRQGKRIASWSAILGRISDYVDAVNKSQENIDSSSIIQVLTVASLALQYGPLEMMIPFSQRLLDQFANPKWKNYFLGFCTFSADIGRERFQSLILPSFQQFIISQWESHEEQLCLVLPKLLLSGEWTGLSINFPHSWLQAMVVGFENLLGRDMLESQQLVEQKLRLLDSYLDLMRVAKVPAALKDTLLASLTRLIKLYVKQGSADGKEDTLVQNFVLGRCLEFLTQTYTNDQYSPVIGKDVVKYARGRTQQSAYLCGTMRMLKGIEFLCDADYDPLLGGLIENLASPSQELRLLSFDTLITFYQCRNLDIPIQLQIARDLEASGFKMENLRAASLAVRKISSLFITKATDALMKRAIPAYFFGLLHVPLTPLWDDVCKSLKELCTISVVEDAIVERAVTWMNCTSSAAPEELDERAEIATDWGLTHDLPGFSCLNLSRLDEITLDCFGELANSFELLAQRLKHNTAKIVIEAKFNRAQALRLFRYMPLLAEKRSRFIVPTLLEWGLDEVEIPLEEVKRSNDVARSTISMWSRQDKKSLLALFADFNNPSVLYRSGEVYTALLGLLCNGDADVQMLALKALFTWKAPFTKQYEANLLNILDDTRFREEITVFLNSDEAGAIRLEHRQGLLPILLRLLYGRVVTRAGLGGSRGSQEARRKAVFQSLTRLGQEAIHEFVSIALGPLGDGVSISSNIQISPRKQLGMLRMLKDMLETLSDQLQASAKEIVAATMHGLLESSRQLSTARDDAPLEDSSLWRSVRHDGLACLNLLFLKTPERSWIEDIRDPLFLEIINPRLPNLPIETAQAPSSILKLCAAWASSPGAVDLLWTMNDGLLTVVADCLNVASAKDDVLNYILTKIMKPLLELAHDDERVSKFLKEGCGNNFLDRVAKCLRLQPSREVLENSIRAIIELQPYVSGSQGIKSLLSTAFSLVLEPARRVNPRLKGEVLTILEKFLPLFDFRMDPDFHGNSIDSMSTLFSYFQDLPNRQRLVTVFETLASDDQDLKRVAHVCRLLNSQAGSRLGEPDFESRAAAFSKILEDFSDVEEKRSWAPIIHNLLFFIQDEEELSTRSSASYALRRFVRIAAKGGAASQLAPLVDRVMIPAIQKGMRKTSELVRAEYVAVLAELVKVAWPSLANLNCLLATDEETSFFNNILHLQSHRRVRALHRLGAATSKISAANINGLCIPLIENFFYSSEENAQNLAIEAIHTLETLVQGLDWPRHRALLQRTMQDHATFTSKMRIRMLSAIVNGLYISHCQKQAIRHTMNVDGEPREALALMTTLPEESLVSKSLKDSVLSKILGQIHFQDEASIDIRVMLATVAVKIILMLPSKDIDAKLPSVLIDVCNILKSRAQDARDSARKALCDISVLIGSKYFSFVLRQLRTALKRGYQLHVLSFTVHALIIAMQPKVDHGALDYCTDDLVGIVIDDIFGIVGQEKEAQGYLNSMKEFKRKNLGYDTMELLATMTMLPYVSKLIKPIQIHLGRPRPRLEKTDELFRRVREGLRRNAKVKERDFLVLCYELLVDAIQHDEGQDQASFYYSKTTAFAFELLRRVLDKHEDLKTAQNLEGFVPMLASAMKKENEEVQMATMRFLSSIIKVPLQGLDEQCGIYIRQAKRMIEFSTSTNTPNAQAALRLVSAILQERPAAIMKKAHFETDMAFLLGKIKPDLEEPASGRERDRQVAAFHFLKALMARGVLIKEVYEVMDAVREIMIKSASPPIPDLARGVYSRFVLDYFPEEGKGLSKQLDFLTMNLQYEHERGRLSVMEVMAFVLNKTSREAVQAVLVNFFLPLMLVLIVDQSEKCRDSATALLKKIFDRNDKERSKSFRGQLMKWLEKNTDVLWKTAALRAWKVYLEIHQDAQQEAAVLFSTAKTAIQEYVDDDGETPLPLIQNALEVTMMLCDLFKSIAFGHKTTDTWAAIFTLLDVDDQNIQMASAQLTSLYLAHFGQNLSLDSTSQLPMAGSHGLILTAETTQQIIDSSMKVMQTPSSASNTPLISKTTHNLTFIASLSSSSTTPEDSEILLTHTLTHISTTLRRELPPTQPPYTKLAALTLLSNLLSTLPIPIFTINAQSLLTPLYHITSTAALATSTPTSTHPDFARVHEEVISAAQAATATLQEKLGGDIYIREMLEVQKAIRDKREERRGKRAREAVSAPERFEREKKRRMLGKREVRKRKGEIAAGARRGW